MSIAVVESSNDDNIFGDGDDGHIRNQFFVIYAHFTTLKQIKYLLLLANKISFFLYNFKYVIFVFSDNDKCFLVDKLYA